MEKGKKKTGLIIGIIIFVVLAFGSLGVIVTSNITIRRGNVLGEKSEEKKTEPPKQEELEKELNELNKKSAKKDLKKYIFDREQEIEYFYSSNPALRDMKQFERRVQRDNHFFKSNYEKKQDKDLNLSKQLSALNYLYKLTLIYSDRVQGKDYDPEKIKWYKQEIKEALED